MAENTKKVTIISRSEKLSGSFYLQEKIFEHPKIHFIWNSTVDEIFDTKKGYVTGANLKNAMSHQINFFPCQGIFIAIGRQPNTDIFSQIP